MHKVTLYGEPKGRVIAVMVVYNGMEFLKAGIDSTLAELGPDNTLLVVDNDSTDGSFEFVRNNYPEICVLQTHENLGGAGGFSAGMFVAMAVDETEFIWLLDNDIVVEPNALAPLVRCLEQTPDAAAAGSQICLYSDPDIIQEIGATYTAWLGDIKGNYRGQTRLLNRAPFRVDYTAACSSLLRKSAVIEIGRFADIFIFYDDIDWSLRAAESGYSIWAVPESVIRHNYSGLKPLSSWREYYRKRNRAYCLKTHPTKRTGYLPLLVYLAFLNYLRLSHRYTKSHTLAKTYDAALRDFAKNTMGKTSRVELTASATPASSQDWDLDEPDHFISKFGKALIKTALVPVAAALGFFYFSRCFNRLGRDQALELNFKKHTVAQTLECI